MKTIYIRYKSAIVTFCTVVALSFLSRNPISTFAYFSATLMFFITFSAWDSYTATRKIYNNLPWLETWNSFFCLMYILPLFFSEGRYEDVDIMANADYLMLVSLFSLVAFNIAFTRIFKSGIKKIRTPYVFDRQTLFKLASAFFFLGFLINFPGIFMQFGILSQQIFCALILACVYNIREGIYNHTQKLIIFVIIIAFYAQSLGYYIGQVLYFTLTLILVYTSARKVSPKRYFIIVFILFLIIQPAKQLVRVEYKDAMPKGMAAIKAYASKSQDFWKKQLNGAKDLAATLWESGLSRMGYLLEFGMVVDKVPDKVDYYKGEWYIKALTIYIIPRVFWPDKPDAHESIRQYMKDIHHRTTTEETGTHINPGYLGDLYLNFGFLGCIIGSLIFGTFMGFLNREFNKGDVDIFYKLMFFFIYPAQVLDPRSYIGNSFYFMIIGMILIRYFGRKKVTPGLN